MKRFLICAMILSLPAGAQVASHAPTLPLTQKPASYQPAGKPVARVNGTVLTDRDLQREMFTIFPYARQHGGQIPPELEPGIRKGALEMIIFEELVYQEAERRKMTISAEQLGRAEADFRKQFPSSDEYNSFLQSEFHGSQRAVREQIQRSLLIEEMLKTEVENKSIVSVAEARAYYDQNSAIFQYPESFAIQTISFLAPQDATPAQISDARKRADAAVIEAKATKTYEEFGLLAEKISEDDYRVMMGDHRAVDRAKLAPSVVKALLDMQPGQVSGVIQVETAYTIVRLTQHIPAGKRKFEDVREDLRKQLQNKKTNQVRANLDKKLREKAKVEVL